MPDTEQLGRVANIATFKKWAVVAIRALWRGDGFLHVALAEVSCLQFRQRPGVVVVLGLLETEPQPEPFGVEPDARVEVAYDEADVEDRVDRHHSRQT